MEWCEQHHGPMAIENILCFHNLQTCREINWSPMPFFMNMFFVIKIKAQLWGWIIFRRVFFPPHWNSCMQYQIIHNIWKLKCLTIPYLATMFSMLLKGYMVLRTSVVLQVNTCRNICPTFFYAYLAILQKLTDITVYCICCNSLMPLLSHKQMFYPIADSMFALKCFSQGKTKNFYHIKI